MVWSNCQDDSGAFGNLLLLVLIIITIGLQNEENVIATGQPGTIRTRQGAEGILHEDRTSMIRQNPSAVSRLKEIMSESQDKELVTFW
jgi:hypothetical protein